MTDTPPVEEGGDQVRVSREELAISCCVDTIGVSGKDGGTEICTKYIRVIVIIHYSPATMMLSDPGGPPRQVTVVPLSEDTSVSVVRVEVRLSLLTAVIAAWNMNPSTPKGCRVLEEVVTICDSLVAG